MMRKAFYRVLWVVQAIAVMCTSVQCTKKTDNTQPAAYVATPYTYQQLPYYISPVSLHIPADNPLTNEGIALGRMLFYDSILSKDRTISCASCHHQANAFTDRGRRFSLGVGDSVGTRNSMALFNIPWQRGGFFWDGRAANLDSQIVGPVPNPAEMHLQWPDAVARLQASKVYPDMFKKAFGSSTVSRANTAKAIAQFLRTITSFNSKFDSVQLGLATFTEAELRGSDLFNNDPQVDTGVNKGHRLHAKGSGVDCFHCHAPPLFGVSSFNLNNDLMMNDGIGTIKVKIPSLRNLKYTAPYMHDGSIPNIDSVIAHYDHGIDPNSPYPDYRMYAKLYTSSSSSQQLVTPFMELTPQEISDLKAFLNTLNDNTLLTNKAYSNPFQR